MLVSHTQKFIFLKTPKTAGTSVEIFLERYCRPDPENIRHGTEEHISEIGIVGARMPGAGQGNLRRFWNHMTASDLQQALEPQVWEGYLKVCPMRNPYDQAVSLFWMELSKPERIDLAKAGLDQASEAFRSWLGRLGPKWNISRPFWSIDGVKVVDRVLRYETLEADCKDLCNDLDVPFESLGRYKTEYRKSDLPFQVYYDEASAAKIASSYDLEFEQFGYNRNSWRT